MALYKCGGSSALMIDLGTATSFDINSVCTQYGIDKTTLTNDNFFIKTFTPVSNTGWNGSQWAADWSRGEEYLWMNKSYNSSTGIFTCSMYAFFRNRDSNNHAPYTMNRTQSVNAILIIGI